MAERASNAEMDHHLGQDERAGNSRNGYDGKTVATDIGKIEIKVARGRQVSAKSRLGEAIRYTLPRWDGLIRFLEMAASISTTMPSNAPSGRSPSTARTPYSPAPTREATTGR